MRIGLVRRLGLAQRIVIAVAFGAMCLATGFWVAATYGPAGNVPTGWTGYAPLQLRTLEAPLTTTDVLFVWLGIAVIWGVVSIMILHLPNAKKEAERNRQRWLAQGEPSIRHAEPTDTDAG